MPANAVTLDRHHFEVATGRCRRRRHRSTSLRADICFLPTGALVVATPPSAPLGGHLARAGLVVNQNTLSKRETSVHQSVDAAEPC